MNYKKVFVYLALCIPIFLYAKGESGYIDKTHRLLSEWIYNTSNKIDTFFAKKDIKYDTKNSSYINISFNSYIEEHQDEAYRFNINARIRLPKTQKSLHLVMEDYKKSISADQQTSSSLTDTVGDDSYLVGIELDNIDTRYTKFKIGSGVHFSGISPDAYVSLYMAKIDYFEGNWQAEINNDAKYFIRDKLNNTTQILISKILNENYKFTFLNAYHYNEDKNNLNEMINAFILDRYISSIKGISGSFSLYSSMDDNSDFKLHYYLLQASYKRFFYHNYAYYELSPGVIFRDSVAFKPRARVVFQVGIYFSKFALHGYSKF